MLWPSVHVESLEAGYEINEGINNDSNRVDALPSQSEGQESKSEACLFVWVGPEGAVHVHGGFSQTS